jgi:hypothetical protein
MRNSRRVSSFSTGARSTCALWCLPVALSLGACTIHEESEPPAQAAPAAVAPAPVPVAAAPVAAAPAAAPAAQPISNYRPTVEAPSAAARAPSSSGAASAPPATHVAAAPAAGVASAPPAGGYVDDPAVVVGTAPPAPRAELMSPSPGAGFAWVPGHWAWRSSWLWVPGSWKQIPAGRRQWVAGQWLAQASQYRWQPGYWA